MNDGDRETDRLLGQLIADGQEHKRQLSALFAKMDTLAKEQSEGSGVAKEALRLATEIAHKINTEIKPATDDYLNLRAKGAGVLGVIALLGGGVAAIGQKVLASLGVGHG